MQKYIWKQHIEIQSILANQTDKNTQILVTLHTDPTPHTLSHKIFNSFSSLQPINFKTLYSTKSDDLT